MKSSTWNIKIFFFFFRKIKILVMMTTHSFHCSSQPGLELILWNCIWLLMMFIMTSPSIDFSLRKLNLKKIIGFWNTLLPWPDNEPELCLQHPHTELWNFILLVLPSTLFLFLKGLSSLPLLLFFFLLLVPFKELVNMYWWVQCKAPKQISRRRNGMKGEGVHISCQASDGSQQQPG